jgi:hypothetical protein
MGYRGEKLTDLFGAERTIPATAARHARDHRAPAKR